MDKDQIAYSTCYILTQICSCIFQDSLNLIKEVDSFGDIQDIKPDVEQLRLLNVLNLRQNSDTPTSSGDQAPLQFVQISRNLQDEEEDG